MTPDTEKLGGVATDAAVVANLAMDVATATADVKTLPGHRAPFTINPRTGSPVSLVDYLDKPLEIRERRIFTEFESFTSYVSSFKREGAVIFGEGDSSGHEPKLGLTAILDYHGAPDKPEHGHHRAILSLTHTESYQAWMKMGGKAMPQLDFVEFLEERAKEIIEPSGAEILELARDLHVVNGGECRSAVREGNEMKVEFLKTEKIKAGGTVSIPTQFHVRIQPFEDQPQVIDTIARLRVRAREGTVVFTFSLEEVRRHTREAFKAIAQAAGKAAAVPVFV